MNIELEKVIVRKELELEKAWPGQTVGAKRSTGAQRPGMRKKEVEVTMPSGRKVKTTRWVRAGPDQVAQGHKANAARLQVAAGNASQWLNDHPNDRVRTERVKDTLREVERLYATVNAQKRETRAGPDKNALRDVEDRLTSSAMKLRDAIWRYGYHEMHREDMRDKLGEKAKPTQKDHARVQRMVDTAYRNAGTRSEFEGAQMQAARTMAAKIKSPDKAFRRGQAMLDRSYFPPAADKFFNRASQLMQEQESRKPAAAKPSIPRSEVGVLTGEFEASHGRRPRSDPHGPTNWAFRIGDETRFYYGTLGEATRQAKQHASERGHSKISVLP